MKFQKIYRTLFEVITRSFMMAFFLGMIWTVYSNHNPDVLENTFALRLVSVFFLAWILVPFYDFYEENKPKEKIKEVSE